MSRSGGGFYEGIFSKEEKKPLLGRFSSIDCAKLNIVSQPSSILSRCLRRHDEFSFEGLRLVSLVAFRQKRTLWNRREDTDAGELGQAGDARLNKMEESCCFF